MLGRIPEHDDAEASQSVQKAKFSTHGCESLCCLTQVAVTRKASYSWQLSKIAPCCSTNKKVIQMVACRGDVLPLLRASILQIVLSINLARR